MSFLATCTNKMSVSHEHKWDIAWASEVQVPIVHEAPFNQQIVPKRHFGISGKPSLADLDKQYSHTAYHTTAQCFLVFLLQTQQRLHSNPETPLEPPRTKNSADTRRAGNMDLVNWASQRCQLSEVQARTARLVSGGGGWETAPSFIMIRKFFL